MHHCNQTSVKEFKKNLNFYILETFPNINDSVLIKIGLKMETIFGMSFIDSNKIVLINIEFID